MNIDEANSNNKIKVLCILVSYFCSNSRKVVIEMEFYAEKNMCVFSKWKNSWFSNYTRNRSKFLEIFCRYLSNQKFHKIRRWQKSWKWLCFAYIPNVLRKQCTIHYPPPTQKKKKILDFGIPHNRSYTVLLNNQ